tara:strand:+ start:888 stop:1091 length:204 start_codon:yes stop_codon:yes gene_type:complete
MDFVNFHSPFEIVTLSLHEGHFTLLNSGLGRGRGMNVFDNNDAIFFTSFEIFSFALVDVVLSRNEGV